MIRIAVFTDIHFNVNRDKDTLDPVKRLQSGIAHALNYVDGLGRIVITGDLTHHGDIASYELLKNSLPETRVPILLMVGNHDNRENFLSVFSDSPIDDDGRVQQVIDQDEHRLIFLDTLDGPPYNFPLSHRGMLCEKRLAWLRNQLSTAGEKECVIFMHHHPHDVGFRAMDTIRLINGDEFYAVVEEFNNVKHISCGHVHRTISGNHRGISFSVFKSTVGQMPMIFDKMDFKMETPEPAAFGLLDITKDGVTVHTEDFQLTDLSAFR